MKRVALGLSGGVDSAVSAYLLKRQGFDISCIYLNCYDADIPGCRTKQDRADALKIALHLNLPFQILDFRKEYQMAVIGYFKKEYLAGRTPNPDVVCNRDIKFGLFLDWAIKHHFDAIATGHYAKIISAETIENRRSKIDSDNQSSILNSQPLSSTFYNPSSAVALVRPADEHKDQTYFLWAIPRQKFQHVLFPLANYLKSEVRQIAHRIKLPVADKKDSTGICFVGEVGVEEFLKKLGVKEKMGEVVIRVNNAETIDDRRLKMVVEDRKSKIDSDNLSSTFHHLPPSSILHAPSSAVAFQVIGSHRGVWFYTIGQRHGFDVTAWPPKNSRIRVDSRDRLHIRDKVPLYVISKDIKTNRLLVGFGPECYRDSFEVADCNWLGKVRPLNLPGTPGRSDLKKSAVFNCLVRLRHCGDLIPCKLLEAGSRRLEVALAAPARGIAPGQSAVFYTKNGTVLGGGVIQ